MRVGWRAATKKGRFFDACDFVPRASGNENGITGRNFFLNSFDFHNRFSTDNIVKFFAHFVVVALGGETCWDGCFC